MDLLPSAGIALGVGYLLGSVPFSWILVRARKGVDLRTVGSGNVGATNAARVLGARWFPLLFVLDFGKGLVPVLVANHWPHSTVEGAGWARVAVGLGAVLGHSFPFWLGFRGGKGVATGTGVAFGLAPVTSAVGIATFALVAGVSRFVSLGSIAGVAAACAAHPFLSEGDPPSLRVPVMAFLGVLLVLVLTMHRSNLRRIALGTEPRIFEKAKAPAGQDPPRAD